MDALSGLDDEVVIDLVGDQPEPLEQPGEIAHRRGVVPGPTDGLLRAAYRPHHQTTASLGRSPTTVEQTAHGPAVQVARLPGGHRSRALVGEIDSGGLG